VNSRKSIYYRCIQFLIDNNSVNVAFAHDGLSFDPPYDLSVQESLFRNNSILRMLEIEPVEVVENYLKIKINIIVSLKANRSNLKEIYMKLSLNEKKVFNSIIEDDQDDKNASINIEHNIIFFTYDCETFQFKISKHQKLSICMINIFWDCSLVGLPSIIHEHQ